MKSVIELAKVSTENILHLCDEFLGKLATETDKDLEATYRYLHDSLIKELEMREGLLDVEFLESSE